MTRLRRALAAAALCLTLSSLTLSSCQSSTTTGADVTSTIDTAAVRTDREPIANRFPLLGTFVDAHWVGGRLGDDRAPGPSTYFIEAVVTLAPADVARLSSQYGFAPAPIAPKPPGSLAPFLTGAGDWSSSPELAKGIGPKDWNSDVYVQLGAGIAYISARGE